MWDAAWSARNDTPSPAADVLPPWELDPTAQGVHTGSGVLNVLLLNLAICVGTLPVWLCWLKKLPIYQTTGTPPDIWLLRVLRDDGFKAWVAHLVDPHPFEHVARCYGTDTALYIAFLKVATLSAAALCLPALFIFPVHLYAASTSNMTEVVETTDNRTLVYWEDELFTRHTVQAVQNDAGVLYLHVAGLVFQTVVTLWLIGVFRRTAKKIFAANDPMESSLARRTIKLRRFPAKGVSEEDLRGYYEAKFPGQVEGVYIAYDVRDRIGMSAQLREVMLRLKFESQKAERDAETMGRLERRREGVVEDIREWHEDRPTASAGFAHVVFRNTATQLRALRQRRVVLADGEARIELRRAHHPRDIHWEDVGRPASTFRAAFINIMLLAGLIFLSTPAAIFTTLQRATERVPVLQKLFSGVTPGVDADADASLKTLLFEYLPVVSYLLLALTLPLIIEWVSGKQAVTSRFRKRKLVMTRLYAYQMLCTFILPSIALSTIMAIIEVFSQDTSDRVVKRSVAHLFLPNSGAFFFNILSVYATLGNWWELWRPVELCKYLNCIYQKKFDPKDEWGTWIMEFEFHWHYPLMFVSWAIAFNYSVFIPVVAPALLVLSAAKLHIHASHARSNMMFRRNALDAPQFGKMVKTLVVLWLLSTLICLGFATAFFAFRSSRLAFYPHISVMGFMWIYVAHRLFTTISSSRNLFVHDLPRRGSDEGFVVLTARGGDGSDVEEGEEFEEPWSESEHSGDRVVTHAHEMPDVDRLNLVERGEGPGAHGAARGAGRRTTHMDLEVPTHISFAFSRAAWSSLGVGDAHSDGGEMSPRAVSMSAPAGDSGDDAGSTPHCASLYAPPFYHMHFDPDRGDAGDAAQLAREIGSAVPTPTSSVPAQWMSTSPGSGSASHTYSHTRSPGSSPPASPDPQRTLSGNPIAASPTRMQQQQQQQQLSFSDANHQPSLGSDLDDGDPDADILQPSP